MNLDQRCVEILRSIANDPLLTGKKLENDFSLTRKQLSYALDKINLYLTGRGYGKIERLRTGKFIIPPNVSEEFKSTRGGQEDVSAPYSGKDRIYFMVMILLCGNEELSIYQFTSKLKVSKSTFLLDLKSLREYLASHQLAVSYDRTGGYTAVGSEYQKRKLMVLTISKIMAVPDGWKKLRKMCVLDDELFLSIIADIEALEEKLGIRFTDERHSELAYVFYFSLLRANNGYFLNELPDAFQHITGTKEYIEVSFFAEKYHVVKQPEKMFLTAQIQISNINVFKLMDNDGAEETLFKAAAEIVDNFENLSCIKIKEKTELIEALFQHLKPAFYRIKYNFHIDTNIIDMILPKHNYLHKIVKKALKPLYELVGGVVDEGETAFLTVLFGAALIKEDMLDMIESRRTAVVVCNNGISVSRYFYINLKAMFPEFEFLTCLSVREFYQYKEDFNIVFSTVMLETDKIQFMLTPFLNEASKTAFREKVFRRLEGINLQFIQTAGIIDIIERYATIHDRDGLSAAINEYLNPHSVANTQKGSEESGSALIDIVTTKSVQILDHTLDWQSAIKLAAAPLLKENKIEQRYIDKIIQNILTNQPYLMIADGVIIPHAGIEDGVSSVGITMLVLPERIDVGGYMEADIFIVLCTPNTSVHLPALYKMIEIVGDEANLQCIRGAEKPVEIINLLYEWSD